MLLYRTKNFVSAETLIGGTMAVGGLTAIYNSRRNNRVDE